MSDDNKKVEAPALVVDTSTIKNLFEGTEIPADKQDQFVSIYEAAVKATSKKLADEQIEKTETELKEKVEQYTDYIREEYATKIDEYSDYVASKFMEENKLAITNGVKAEQFDSLMTSLKKIFEEHSISIPEDKVDLVAEMEAQVKVKDNELNEIKKEIIALKNEVAAMKKSKTIAEAVSALADTQKEKVIALAEELVYDETFVAKLSTVVESVKTPNVKIENDDVTPQFIDEKKKEIPATDVKKRKFNPDLM